MASGNPKPAFYLAVFAVVVVLPGEVSDGIGDGVLFVEPAHDGSPCQCDAAWKRARGCGGPRGGCAGVARIWWCLKPLRL